MFNFLEELKNRLYNEPIKRPGKPDLYRYFRCLQCKSLVNDKMIKKGLHLGHQLTNIIGKITIWEMVRLLITKTRK